MDSFLKKFREKADLTQGELAETIGVSRQSVISLESGKCIPSVHLAMKIANFFDVPIEFIFRISAEEAAQNLEDQNNNIGGDMTNLTPWSPWREMMSLRETVDRFFDEPAAAARQGGSFYPSVGIKETKDELVIEADLPGVKEEDVDVEIEGDQVVIRGERKHESESKGEDYYHLESSYGTFSRVIGLPSYVDSQKAHAQIRDGILEIYLPKVEQRKARKIAISGKQATEKKEITKPKK